MAMHLLEFLKYMLSKFQQDILDRLDLVIENQYKIQRSLTQIQKQEDQAMADLSALKAQVQANTDVEASAVVLIKGLAAQLAAVATDPAAVQALADQLKASAQALSEAITANTPAA
jgi:hypothetical protein